jgi:hypothetical protein
VHITLIGVLVCLDACTFTHSVFWVNAGVILALVATVVMLMLARFCWLKQVKGDNGGHIRNGWSEMWELLPAYPPSSVCLWLIFLTGAKLSLDAGTSELAEKLLNLYVAKDD